jgi:ferredoxin
MPGVKVEIDTSFCEGIGYCARICPSVFRVDPAIRKAEVLMPVVTDPALIEIVEQAEMTCPTRAIMVSPADE